MYSTGVKVSSEGIDQNNYLETKSKKMSISDLICFYEYLNIPLKVDQTNIIKKLA